MKKTKYNYNDITYGFYDQIYHKKRGIRSAWHHIKFNFIKNKINKKNIHLDIGCGSGTFVSILNNKYSAGVDISSKQIKFANKTYGGQQKKFFCYKKKIPFKKNKFNSISLIELIEHLSDQEINKLMRQIHNLLKKGGKIYITTPNYLSLWPILELIVNKFSDVSYEHQHINKFHFMNIKKIIDNKKFKIKKYNSFMFLGPFLAFFSFKFSINFTKVDGILTKIFPGFLIFLELEKK